MPHGVAQVEFHQCQSVAVCEGHHVHTERPLVVGAEHLAESLAYGKRQIVESAGMALPSQMVVQHLLWSQHIAAVCPETFGVEERKAAVVGSSVPVMVEQCEIASLR